MCFYSRTSEKNIKALNINVYTSSQTLNCNYTFEHEGVGHVNTPNIHYWTKNPLQQSLIYFTHQQTFCEFCFIKRVFKLIILYFWISEQG